METVYPGTNLKLKYQPLRSSPFLPGSGCLSLENVQFKKLTTLVEKQGGRDRNAIYVQKFNFCYTGSKPPVSCYLAIFVKTMTPHPAIGHRHYEDLSQVNPLTQIPWGDFEKATQEAQSAKRPETDYLRFEHRARKRKVCTFNFCFQFKAQAIIILIGGQKTKGTQNNKQKLLSK